MTDHGGAGQGIGTSSLRHDIDKEDIPPSSRTIRGRDEIVSYIVSDCREFVQKEYKNLRHKVVAIFHGQLCQKHGLPATPKSYEYFVNNKMDVLENEKIKLLWDFPTQTEMKIDHNKRDLVLLGKKEKLAI